MFMWTVPEEAGGIRFPEMELPDLVLPDLSAEIERVFSARAALTAESSQPSEADTGVWEQIATHGHTVGKATL